MGESSKTIQTSVFLSPEELAWVDGQIQEIKRAGWRGVTRSAFIRSLIRAAMQRPPLTMEGVISEEELTKRLSANNSFPKWRESNER